MIKRGSGGVRHILCFGNPLHGDDGFGPAVYRRLAELPQPGDLRLFDAGTPGLSALVLFQDCCEAVIVDASAPAGQPGKLRELPASAIATEPTAVGHGHGVGFLLRALAALPEAPPALRVVTAEAASVVSFRPGLSAPVALAVERTVDLLRGYFEIEST
ncbi:hydrogenase maturation protease [Methylomonas sp. EFPC3]|uniref:hydrogenase maturation protease n=1 Tax=unclassified Methylomonas TaxID=2608980 RepID=UPI0024159CF0|nr:hydrogenase maturation protease [Methylomonas sp. EFPC3]WFP49680.1 hydrogenase maturation protease [Methylomonas sp. EFPC3]